jgi:Ca2+-binding RTX toxin-like protein
MTTYHITTKRKALKGSGADDSFFGSKFKDIFDGRAGDDYIYGDEGNDSLTGGDGNDAIFGGVGSDKALGGLGSDNLLGGLGNDKLYGGEGRDILQGEDGNDSLYGDAGRDSLYGEAGNDKLYGGDEDDYLSGAEGNDRLDGGKGDDNLIGGKGSDYLSGGAGDDVLDGREFGSSIVFETLIAPGKDRLLAGDGNDTIMVDDRDYALGGRGMDTLSLDVYNNSSDYVTYVLNFSKVTGQRAADIGYLGIKAGQFEKVDVSVYRMDVGSVITGSKGNDTIYGNGKSGMINGGAGDDILSAWGYNSENPANGIVVNGGTGDDKLSGNGDVTLVGGKGADQFILSRYSDSTIADFSGKDYFLVDLHNFEYYDYIQGKYVVPTFDVKHPLVVGTDPKPATALAQFFYDTDDGKLYFDADGIGENYDLELVVTLANKASLNASDFVFVT